VPPIILLHDSGRGHLKSVASDGRDIMAVDISFCAYITEHNPVTQKQELYMRILEVIAHGFHSYFARECVKGLFTDLKKTPIQLSTFLK
jgi:hypothetical protein